MNRQQRRSLDKQENNQLVKKVVQLDNQLKDVAVIAEQEINRRAKDIASTVLIVQLMPIVQKVLIEDFDFSDGDINKFNEQYQLKVDIKLNEIDKKLQTGSIAGQ